MILNFWDHPHFIIAENACDVTNNTWPHKQIEIFLECFTTYIFFGQIAVNRGARLTMFAWVMEILLDILFFIKEKFLNLAIKLIANYIATP